MKKGYVLILSLFLILTLSYVSAADNGTDIIKQENDGLISIDEQDNDSISLSSEAAVINESSNATGELLGSAGDDEILTVPSSDVLSTCVNVTPLSSSYYKEPTKKERTFNIGGFKAVLSETQYKKFYKVFGVEDDFFEDEYYDYYDIGDKYKGYYVTSTGLRYQATVKTNKYIKVKVKIGNKYKIKKTRALMQFTYGAGQSGIAYRYIVSLTHKYANLGYDYFKVLGNDAKYFGKCKQSTDFTKLNKSKLYWQTYVYNKYAMD